MEQTKTMIHRRFIRCPRKRNCAHGGKDWSVISQKFRVSSYIWSHAAAKSLLLLLIFLHEVGPWSQGRNWERVGAGTETPNLFQLCISPIFLNFLLLPRLARAVQAQPSYQNTFFHVCLYNQSLLIIEMQHQPVLHHWLCSLQLQHVGKIIVRNAFIF